MFCIQVTEIYKPNSYRYFQVTKQLHAVTSSKNTLSDYNFNVCQTYNDGDDVCFF